MQLFGLLFFLAFLLMIPLIVHHRIIDPFDITLTACAEEWHQNMNARLAYDFILLFLLFILPLSLMTYCYIRISFSLWFIDSPACTSLSSSSITNGARFSNISEEFPQVDVNGIRRQSSQKHRPYYIHYHKTYENDSKRKQQQQPQQKPEQEQEMDEYQVLINSSHRPRRSTTINEIKPKSSSITTMVTTAPIPCRRSSSLMGRRFGENGFIINQQGRPVPVRHRQSTSPYTSGILRTSLTSLQSQNRILGGTNGKTHHHRSIVDVERASRFLQSRRRVVKLLITLGNPIYFSFPRSSLSFFSSSIRFLSHTTSIQYSFDLYRYYFQYVFTREYIFKSNESRRTTRCCCCSFFTCHEY